MASLVLGNIGSSIGGPLGGFIGSAIGSYIDKWLFSPKPDDIHGPRLSDLQTISSEPGTPIPIVYGADRIAGIVIHTTNIIETVHKEKVGGKGGPPKQTVYTYTYHVDIDYMLCEGPILGVGRIWADGRLLRGTSYQLSLDTEANFEKIGGIPYEDWYKSRVYDPATVPWSYDPTYTPTIEPQKYRWSLEEGFVPVTDEIAQGLLDYTKEVVYAYDTGSEKYLPIPASHDYTGARLKGLGGQEIIRTTDSVPSLTNRNAFTTETTVRFNIDAVNQPDPPDSFFGILGDIIGGVLGENVDNTTVIDRYAVLSADVQIKMQDGASGVFGTDYGFGTFTEVGLTYGTAPGGTSVGSGAFVSTPGIDGLPQGNPSSRTLSVRTGSLDDSADYYEANIKITSSLVNFAHETLVRNAKLIRTTIVQEGPDIIRNWPEYYNFYDAINDWSPKAVLQFHGPDGVALYRGTDDQIADPTMELHGDADCGVPAYIGRAHIVFQRLELEDFGNRIPNLTFEVVQSDDARIRNVITDLMTRAELDTSLWDIDALPETSVPSYVMGYTIGTATSYRAALEPLLDAFEVDSAEIGDQLVFRPKRRVADVTIDYNKLAPKQSGDDPEAPMRFSFRDPIELPKSLDIRFKDPEREYQPNSGRFTRQVVPGTQATVAELPVVRQPHIMKEFTRDKMRDLWLERITSSWALPQEYTHISPSDMVKITNSPEGKFDYTFKVTSTNRRSDGNMDMEGVRREPDLYVPVEGELEDNGSNLAFPQGQFVKSLITSTEYWQLNLPALRVQDDNDGYYLAMSGSSNAWPGATFFELVGLTWEEVLQTPASARAGQAYDFSENFNKTSDLYAVDFTSTVQVLLYNPDEVLNSVSDDQFFRLANVAVLGDEIIAFKNATSLGDGLWELDTLLRARLDTEDHANQHITGEQFVILDANELTSMTGEPENVGVAVAYDAVTFGNGFPEGFGATFINTSERLVPFRPVHLNAVASVSDCVITWRRQNRFYFHLQDSGPDIPNSEALERYEVDIHANVNVNTTAIRTIVVDNATTTTYTAAEIAADGFTSGDTMYITVYQISDAIGRGNGNTGEFICP